MDVLATANRYEFRFAWRALQDLDYSYSSMRRKQSYDVGIEGGTLSISGERCRPFEPSEEALARRRVFLESNPDLPSRLRRLIATGWIGSGMTKEMVTASWGEPRSAGFFVYERHGESVRLSFDRDGLLGWSQSPRLSAGLNR